MSRGLTAGMLAALSQGIFRPVIFVEAEFVSGYLRLFSGLGTKSWNSQTWYGAGDLMVVSAISDTEELKATAMSIAVSGIPSANISRALDECRPNYPVRVWFGALDVDGSVIADPVQCFDGKMDVPTIDQGGDSCTISITVETELADLQRARVRRYTDEDQKSVYPGDRFCEFVTKIQDANFTWGGKPAGQIKGSGGGCFSAAVGIMVPGGMESIGWLPRDREFTIVNNTGKHQARLIVHECWSGWTRKLGPEQFVTEDHPMGERGDVPAGEKYSMYPRLWYVGTVFTMEIVTAHDEDRHFLLFNGDVAHNKIPIGDEGGHDRS
jgi:hypothetical protein